MTEATSTIPTRFSTLLVGILITGVYYLSASTILPQDAREGENLDGYYFKHGRLIVGAVVSCNWASFLSEDNEHCSVPGASHHGRDAKLIAVHQRCPTRNTDLTLLHKHLVGAGVLPRRVSRMAVGR
jgi:hypothetical protein